MIICSKCGFENQLGHIFCSRCRTRLDLRQVADRDLSENNKPRGRKWLRIMLFFEFLIVVAIAMAFYPLSTPVRRGTPADLQQARRKLAMMESGAPMSSHVFTEAEVNAGLAVNLNGKRNADTYEIRSVQATLKPNAVVLAVTASWSPVLPNGVKGGQYDITYDITGVPALGADGFRFQVSRGMIGHLPLPGPVSLAFAPQVKAYFKGLRLNYPMLDAVQRFELEEGRIILFLAK
jgi:hypothetical protein